jgi:hypothetical protein
MAPSPDHTADPECAGNAAAHAIRTPQLDLT